MNKSLPQKLPKDYPFKGFGETNNFIYQYYNGWLFAICFGGTAFAREAKDENEAQEFMKPILKLSEYDVIRYCNSIFEWMVFDYHSWKLQEGIMTMKVYENGKYKETVQ